MFQKKVFSPHEQYINTHEMNITADGKNYGRERIPSRWHVDLVYIRHKIKLSVCASAVQLSCQSHPAEKSRVPSEFHRGTQEDKFLQLLCFLFACFYFVLVCLF